MREKVAVGRLTLRPDFYYNKCVAFPAFVQRASTVAKGALPIRCGLAQIRIKPPQNRPMLPGRLRPWDGDVFMTHFIKRTWAEIDLDAAAHNFSVIRRAAGERAVVAVVKADAYGHGAARMARLYDALGVERFAVSNIEEAAELRRAGLRQPILILGYTPAEEAAALHKYDAIQALLDMAYAKKLSAAALRAGVEVKISLKLDSGMGRIGFDCRSETALPETVRLAAEAARLPGLLCDGAFTHFAAADRDSDPDGVFTAGQRARFFEAVEGIRAAGVRLPFVHCCNSAGTMLQTEKPGDGVRAGIILYGLTPSPGLEFIKDFRPVLSLYSTVSMVKTIRAGESVSYGRTFTAEREMTVATVSAGYADGYPRALSNKGRVLIRGRFASVIGRVCMDQFVVDVSAIPGVEEGDRVTLIGREGENAVPVEEIAALTGTINYEVVCDIGYRVPRIYMQNGEVESVLDHLVRGSI